MENGSGLCEAIKDDDPLYFELLSLAYPQFRIKD